MFDIINRDVITLGATIAKKGSTVQKLSNYHFSFRFSHLLSVLLYVVYKRKYFISYLRMYIYWCPLFTRSQPLLPPLPTYRNTCISKDRRRWKIKIKLRRGGAGLVVGERRESLARKSIRQNRFNPLRRISLNIQHDRNSLISRRWRYLNPIPGSLMTGQIGWK
jgi:hypothetical protein